MTVLAPDFDSLNLQLESASPDRLLQWAVETFGDGLAVVTSFQPTGIITLHMLHTLGLRVPVLTLDTGLLFPESVKLIDTLERRFGLALTRVRPGLSLDAQAVQYGAALWEHDPDTCCNLRKVQPLGAALAPYTAWITGVRRDQSQERQHTAFLSPDRRYGKIKLSPFANWTETMVWDYLHAHNLPYNPLHDAGYPSIGCAPCTHPAPSDNPRGGRWKGHTKTECGIHLTLR
jgi:phosphoadenosine phosphosulfate reductase